jgi:ubiquinone/menaquinone biosynthesis C-methylase UbiE
VATRTERSFKPALAFDRLTPLFDPVVALTTRERKFKARVLDRAAIQPGEHVLDLACGTGTLALAALERTPGARLVGADADPTILKRARAKAEAAGAEIRFDEAFSNELPYEDASFDVILTTLFFHHLEDDVKRATATEMLRVLRPGGRLVLADVGRPQDPLMRVVVLGTVQLVDGPATTRSNVAGKLPSMLSDAGFADVKVTDRFRTPTGTIEVVTARRST